MKTLLDLSYNYFKYLLKKKSFIYSNIIILLVAFFIIPNENASYVTFYIKNTAAIPNKFWIGNLAAVFSNLAISFLLLYSILGEKDKEIKQKIYFHEDTSPIITFIKNFYKILALFLVSLLYLFILNASLLVMNFENIDFLFFIIPLIYFCVPFLFLLSVLCYITEYYIIYKGLKYFSYYILIILLFSQDKLLYNPFGIYELSLYLGNYLSDYNYSFGVLSKSKNLKFININEFKTPLFVFSKFIWVLITLFLVIFISKTKKSRKLAVVDQDKPENNINIANKSDITFFNFHIHKSFSFKTLIYKDFYLFSQSFSKINIFLIILIWILLFFVTGFLYKILLPIMFILCLSLNSNFLCKLFYYDISYIEKLSPFGLFHNSISKLLIITLFYIVLLIPHLVFISDINKKLFIIFNFIILAIAQVIITKYLKNSILADLFYIIIFISYIVGNPVFNILKM